MDYYPTVLYRTPDEKRMAHDADEKITLIEQGFADYGHWDKPKTEPEPVLEEPEAHDVTVPKPKKTDRKKGK